jgi:uncharacterized membrane protein
MLLSACSGKSNQSGPDSPKNGAPIIPANSTANLQGDKPAAPAATPQELEAESSLAVKRGVITLTAQSRSFRLCGSSVDLSLTDQLDGALDRTYAELGAKPIYAEVYGERGDAQPGSNAPNSFNVEELLYASPNNATETCNTPLAKFELQARGNEPTWSVDVQQDAMVFRQTTAPTEIKFSPVETADAEGTVTYRAGVDRHVLELVVTQRGCLDKHTHEYYAYSATARLDKQSFSGCARVGE